MKNKKVLSLVFFLLGVIACGIAFQRFIVYQDTSASSRSYDYESERTSGQKRMDLRNEADDRLTVASKAQKQAVFSGFIGIALIITSLVLLLAYFANRNKGKNVVD